MKKPMLVLAILTTMPGAVFLGGCSQNQNALDDNQQAMTNRLDELAKKSGGDWEKLSAEEKRYMIQDVSQGNERAARQLLEMKAGKKPQMQPGRPAKP